MNPVIMFTLAALTFLQAPTASVEAKQTTTQVLPSDAQAGKDIFVARCAKCHDADAKKVLPDGSTLLARLAKNKDPESRLGTRLKNEHERHQVFLYIQTLMSSANPAR